MPRAWRVELGWGLVGVRPRRPLPRHGSPRPARRRRPRVLPPPPLRPDQGAPVDNQGYARRRRGGLVIDHVGLGVSNLEQSKAFYRQALHPHGYQVLLERDGSVGFGRNGKPDFFIHVNRPLSGPTHILTPHQPRPEDHASVPCEAEDGRFIRPAGRTRIRAPQRTRSGCAAPATIKPVSKAQQVVTWRPCWTDQSLLRPRCT
jgi:hypothetical protein